MVFVVHPVTGVQRIARGYMAACESSGFRFATDAKLVGWYAQQDLPRPRRQPGNLPGLPSSTFCADGGRGGHLPPQGRVVGT